MVSVAGIAMGCIADDQGRVAVLSDILGDEERRRIGCRALNTLQADMYAEYADRICPVAVIPMMTPQEAIDELEHAILRLRQNAVQEKLTARWIGHARRAAPAST